MSPYCGKSEDDDPEGKEEGPEGLPKDQISGYIKKPSQPMF